MPLIDIGDLSLWYDIVQGPRADPIATPAVMIQGLGMQATEWPETLIAELAATRRVILLDNRDAGLSQAFGPDIDPALTMEDFPGHGPLREPPPYTLREMAADVIGLLDALTIPTAHMVGFSMGGMIAQVLAAEAPSRVASLVGLMTSAGQAWIDSTPAADRMMRQSILFQPDRDRLIAEMLAAEEVYAGRSPLPSLASRRTAVCQSIARAYRPAGIWRQACAMRASGERAARLRAITAPVLMFHGEDDPVIALRQASLAKTVMPQTEFNELGATGHVLTEQNSEIVAPEINSFWRRHESSASRPC